jgi:hypothetical protein
MLENGFKLLDCRKLSAVAVLGLLLLACGCKYKRSAPPLAPTLTGDSLELIAVKQLDDSTLLSGKPSNFLVRMRYSLESRDSAVLTLIMDQFRNPSSCVFAGYGEDTTAPIALTSADHIVLSRGTHELEIPATWPGGLTSENKQQVLGKGAISFHASLSTEHPQYRFMTRWFGTEFCQEF